MGIGNYIRKMVSFNYEYYWEDDECEKICDDIDDNNPLLCIC